MPALLHCGTGAPGAPRDSRETRAQHDEDPCRLVVCPLSTPRLPTGTPAAASVGGVGLAGQPLHARGYRQGGGHLCARGQRSSCHAPHRCNANTNTRYPPIGKKEPTRETLPSTPQPSRRMKRDLTASRQCDDRADPHLSPKHENQAVATAYAPHHSTIPTATACPEHIPLAWSEGLAKGERSHAQD